MSPSRAALVPSRHEPGCDPGRVDARGMRWVANVSEATGERAATDGWVATAAC